MLTIRFQISQPRSGLIGIDAARHAQHAGNVHEVEGQVEADHEEPEVPLAQRSLIIRPVTFGNQ